MSPQSKSLKDLISQVRSRIRARAVLKGLAITLAITALSLIIAAIAANRVGQKPAALFALRLLPFVIAAASAFWFLLRPLRAKVADSQIARLLEEKCALADRLSTSIEYAENPRDASPAIIDRLVTDTSERCSSVRLDDVVDQRRAYAYAAVAALILIALVGSMFFGPRAVTGGMAALYSTADAVSANATSINVSPGTARAPRGSDQKIRATLSGFESETAQVFIRRNGADVWEAQNMEPARNANEFQFVIFNIQDSISYYVEAGSIRSQEFALEVADLPFVKQIDLVLNFPAYTRLAAKKIENGGEIAALKGTVVEIVAKLTANAKSARVALNDGTKIEMSPDGENQFAAHLTVKKSGTYKIELTSEDGERYNGSNEFDITVLEDQAPTVVIDKPGRDVKVTSIQEVFSQVRAEDDFGVASIELYYSVNGGEEKHVQLQDLKSDTPKTLSGAHTFFLEEFSLQPGDFISYYAKARDNSGEGRSSTSDIYFMEVRPFDREFRQAQAQGGGGGGDQDSNALTRRQREIIAATFRVQREQEGYTPQEKEENFGAVTLSQDKLKADAEALIERIRRRLGDQLGSQPEFAKLVDYVTQATKEMASAMIELRSKKTKEALPPEQRSLQQLLRAEAIFREIQIARGESQGGGQQQNEQELADLFELQLDKMKNQYETVNRQQQAQASQQQDEIARRLEELARRQQQQVEQRMREQMKGEGGGGGGSQRQQQEMIEEAQKLARELERLSRDRRDPKLEEAAKQLQQSADEMRRAQSSSSQQASSQQGGASQQGSSSQRQAEAQAQQMRALERMEQARRMLESSQRAGGQQNVQQLRQQAEEALKRQDEISKSVEEMSRNAQQGGASDQKKQQLAERKQALADKMSGLERDLDQTARGLGQDRQQSSDKLREAASGIRNNRIPDRIRQNNQLIENGWYEQARDRERIIRNNIEDVLKNIQSAEGSATKRAQGESLEDALNRARELADNLESLRRKMESERNGGQSDQGQQQQQQAGQQQGNGQQQQSGQQQGGQQQGGQQQSQAGQGQTGSQSQSRASQGQQRGGQNSRGQQGRRGQQGQQSQGQQSQAGQQQGSHSQQGQQGQGQQGQQSQQGQGQQGQSQQGQQGQGQQGQGRQGQSQQGQQGQQSSQQGQGQQSSQQGGQSSSSSDPGQMTMAGGGPPRGGARQLESELRQRLGEAEELRRALGRNSDLAKDLNKAIEQLRQLNANAFSDPSQLALLKSEVIDPLRQIEIELAKKLQARLGNNGPGALSDGDAPDRYRKMIEDYYRRLSARSPQAKQ